MSDELFREGGPLNVTRKGRDEYEMRISIPTGESGMAGRECPDQNCSPGYFKVKPGTGITEEHDEAFCPYCRTSENSSEFTTQAQIGFATALIENEAEQRISQMLSSSLGLGPSGSKKIGNNLFSVEVSLESPSPRYVPRLIEEELRRDVVCPYCGLEHAVFGLAVWCADCGQDIFLEHVAMELQVIEKMLSSVETREKELGPRVAGKDIENALEDIVSIFEAVLKIITRKHLVESGMEPSKATSIIENKVQNRYQNVERARSTFKEWVGNDLFDGISNDDVEYLRLAFEKRHPITHNLGVVDRKYLARVRTGELSGREIRISASDVLKAMEIASATISSAYCRAFNI